MTSRGRAMREVGALVASAALGLSAAIPAQAMGTPPKPPKFKQSAPVSNEATVAYQFRTRIKTEARCEVHARDADAIFLWSEQDNLAKAERLRVVEAQATAADCLLPA